MADLERLLAPPRTVVAPPGDFLDVVRVRARRLRRRRAGVAGGALASVVAAALLVSGGGTSVSLQPTDAPARTAPPSVSPPATAARPGPRATASPSEIVVVARPTAAPAVPRRGAAPSVPPAPSAAPFPYTFREWRGTPPATVNAGKRCVHTVNPAPDFSTGWLAGPPGWCYLTTNPQDTSDPAPRTLTADVWNLGVWVCREEGTGAGSLALHGRPRLVLTRGEATSGNGGEIVFDSVLRWPGQYRTAFSRRIDVADGACVLLYVQWDSKTSAGEALPQGTYYFEFFIPDAAWEEFETPPRHTVEHRPGDVH